MDELLPKIDKATWPTDTRTLGDLIETFTKEVPSLDDQIADLLRQNPDLVRLKTDARGKKAIADYMLGRIVAISILNFLCRAYGRPDLGYVPRSARDKSN